MLRLKTQLKALLAVMVFQWTWAMNAAAPFQNASHECPNVPRIHNFTMAQHLGDWLLYEYYDTLLLEELTCVRFRFSEITPGGISIVITGIRDIKNDKALRIWRDEENVMTYGCMFNSSDQAILLIQKTNQTALEHEAYFVIVDSDYESYTVLYACFEPLLSEEKIEFLWILSRPGHKVPLAKINEVKTELHKLGVKTNTMLGARQFGCTRYADKFFWSNPYLY